MSARLRNIQRIVHTRQFILNSAIARVNALSKELISLSERLEHAHRLADEAIFTGLGGDPMLSRDIGSISMRASVARSRHALAEIFARSAHARMALAERLAARIGRDEARAAERSNLSDLIDAIATDGPQASHKDDDPYEIHR